MEKQELLEKAKTKTITREDIFDYFGVKNMEGLESVFSNKFDQPKDNLSYLDGSLQYIYAVREKQDYSPIEEMYMFYGIAAEGIYGVSMDEISILNGYFGAFKVLMMLSAILKDKPEVAFFEYLYKKYIERKENITFMILDGVLKVVKFAQDNLGNLDEKKLQELISEFKVKADQLVKEKDKYQE
jgi:hypothetical protein